MRAEARGEALKRGRSGAISRGSICFLDRWGLSGAMKDGAEDEAMGP